MNASVRQTRAEQRAITLSRTSPVTRLISTASETTPAEAHDISEGVRLSATGRELGLVRYFAGRFIAVLFKKWAIVLIPA